MRTRLVIRIAAGEREHHARQLEALLDERNRLIQQDLANDPFESEMACLDLTARLKRVNRTIKEQMEILKPFGMALMAVAEGLAKVSPVELFRDLLSAEK